MFCSVELSAVNRITVVGFAELAAAPDADDEERQSYIEIIRENSGYLQKLVDDVS